MAAKSIASFRPCVLPLASRKITGRYLEPKHA